MLKYITALLIIFCSVIFSQTPDDKEYTSYEGRTIRKIIFRIIDVSGPSVDDTNDNDSSWFSGLVNSLHYETREWVVRNYLLFREGDPFDAFEMIESEKLLRETQYFVDARIKVLPTQYADSVDLTVTTKEKWTIMLNLSLNAQKNSFAGIREDNLMGMGHEFEGTISRDNNPVNGWGYQLRYGVNNTAASFVDITASLNVNNRSSIKIIDLSRPFITQKIHFAGGFSFQNSDSKLIFVNRDSSDLVPFSNNTFDMWTGYSFPIWFGDEVFRKRTTLISAVRMKTSWYSKRPFVSSDSNKLFINNNIFLLSTGLINRSYYREHYINRFGPTEDIPVGSMLVLTGGYDVSEYKNRYYAGAEGVISRRINDIGYFSFLTEAGGYFKKGSWEQNAYNFDLLFHSVLTKFNDWKLRFFMQNKYLIGNSRFEQEQIFLDTENGLRGHERFMLQGISRGLLKMEARVFSPFEPFGFALGASLFADLGIISANKENLFNSKVYQGYGAGLKISNESISEAQFDVAIVYRPYTHAETKGSFAILFTGSLLMGSRIFNFPKPSTVNYIEN